MLYYIAAPTSEFIRPCSSAVLPQSVAAAAGTAAAASADIIFPPLITTDHSGRFSHTTNYVFSIPISLLSYLD